MLTSFNQNWRTSSLPFSLSLANSVNTGTSFTTPSGATQNSQVWASAGFRGYGPVMTFPGGAGMDGLGMLMSGGSPHAGGGCGCGCGGKGGCGHHHGMGKIVFSPRFNGVSPYALQDVFRRPGLGQSTVGDAFSQLGTDLGMAFTSLSGMDWLVLGGTALVLFSVFSTTRRAARGAHGAVKTIHRKAKAAIAA